MSAVSDLYFIYCVTSRTLNFDCIENKESRVRPEVQKMRSTQNEENQFLIFLPNVTLKVMVVCNFVGKRW